MVSIWEFQNNDKVTFDDIFFVRDTLYNNNGLVDTPCGALHWASHRCASALYVLCAKLEPDITNAMSATIAVRRSLTRSINLDMHDRCL